VTIGVIEGENVMVPVDIRIGKWTSPQTAEQIQEVFRMFQPRIIYVENNALQEALEQWMRDSAEKGSLDRMPIEGYLTTKKKADPLLGLPGIEVEMKNRMWMIPGKDFLHHTTGCGCAWCVLKEEITSYPFSATTDVLMALWFCREAVRKYIGLGSVMMTKEDYDDLLKNTKTISKMNTDELERNLDRYLSMGSFGKGSSGLSTEKLW
jgi:hypothetical protein